jgi:hypothetical protein
MFTSINQPYEYGLQSYSQSSDEASNVVDGSTAGCESHRSRTLANVEDHKSHLGLLALT